MTKREFLDIVFALAPTEANAIMDAFDEYVDSNEPHWIPCSERLPDEDDLYLVTRLYLNEVSVDARFYYTEEFGGYWNRLISDNIIAWMPLPEPFKEVTDGRD